MVRGRGCTTGGSTGCEQLGALSLAPSRGAFAAAAVGDTTTDAIAGATLPDGNPYPGDLLADILEYRTLRASALGGHDLEPTARDRYESLQSLLCASDEREGHGRAYRRFDLRMPARLRFSRGRSVDTVEVGIDNVSAGGVKLFGSSARAEGERVELVLADTEHRTVVLPARVAWMRGPSLGLMFAGAARWR
ncbi:MAG: PilZ domain-containing protein [Myxococcota bacterium]